MIKDGKTLRKYFPLTSRTKKFLYFAEKFTASRKVEIRPTITHISMEDKNSLKFKIQSKFICADFVSAVLTALLLTFIHRSQLFANFAKLKITNTRVYHISVLGNFSFAVFLRTTSIKHEARWFVFSNLNTANLHVDSVSVWNHMLTIRISTLQNRAGAFKWKWKK